MVILPSVSRGGSAAPRDSASNVMRENTKHMQQCCSHILPTFLQNFLYLLLFLWTYVFSGSVTHSHTDPTGPIQDFRVLLRSLRASDAHFQVHHNSTSVFCEPTAYMMCQPQPHMAQKNPSNRENRTLCQLAHEPPQRSKSRNLEASVPGSQGPGIYRTHVGHMWKRTGRLQVLSPISLRVASLILEIWYLQLSEIGSAVRSSPSRQVKPSPTLI
jgi:hypothetical protein